MTRTICDSCRAELIGEAGYKCVASLCVGAGNVKSDQSKAGIRFIEFDLCMNCTNTGVAVIISTQKIKLENRIGVGY